ncbi:hypothetical protein EGI22_11125 [Lacihabitans sp. LS3-19]|uniref:hypothetical protein n=1 Tax=Lacihabitans sp. LS3-19 TaxID=2487335 RepID=UPI0020CF8909|nr:hypothetical protein [Lacihabitans sp. LS3-19]MCP9768466.1 hypothetical protein [Lacihabitans sp. LS3-19]
MKTKHILLVLILLSFNFSFAQSPKEGLAFAKNMLSLIKQNKAAELATMVYFPLERPNPIPDIQDEQAFVAYFPTLFDEKFRKMIPATIKPENILAKNGIYGLVGGPFAGEIWFDEEGIMSINYNSVAEMTLEKTLDAKVKALIHPSVNQWESNIFVGKSKNLLVRIDLMKDDTYRYASWSKGKPISEKPDLVILGGEMDIQGTMGGPSWLFKNKNWEYFVMEDYECEECEASDKVLVLSENGVVKSKIILNSFK